MPPRKKPAPMPQVPTTPVSSPIASAPIVSAPTFNRGSSLLNLPVEIVLSAPDFQSMLPTDWFSDSSSLQRQTDEAREQIKLSIHEKRNTVATLRDNIALATDIVGAATDFTKLGKQMISYQIGLEAMTTENVKLNQQQTRTQLEQIKLGNLQQDVQGTQALGAKQGEVWQSRLDELDNRIKEMRDKSRPYLPIEG
jgi:hypothetical protein